MAIQTLIRRVPGITKNEQLNRIYANLSGDYQLYIKRTEFTTLKTLIRLGEDYEYKIKHRHLSDHHNKGNTSNPKSNKWGNSHRNATLQTEIPTTNTQTRAQQPPQRSNPFRQPPAIPRSSENPNTQLRTKYVCFNCNEEGHTSRYCRSWRRPFCKDCRKRGVRTEDCQCQKQTNTPSFCATCRRQGYTTETCPCATAGPSTQTASQFNATSNYEENRIIDQRPRRKVQILGKTFNALLDSGATTSYINDKVSSWLEVNEEPRIRVNVCTYMANRAPDYAEHAYDIELHIGNKSINSVFLVMRDMLDEVTIGSDVLSKLNFELIEVDKDPRIHRMSSLIQREHLSQLEEKVLQQFLDNELPKASEINGGTSLVEHRICMKNDIPIRQRYFPKNPKMREIINKQVEELLAKGQIEPSASPYCSPIVLVKKKDNSWRMCVDFRKINENSERDAYPMPHIPSILNRLKKARYVSSIDLKQGYWQVPIRAEDRQYTAFVVPGKGLYQWRVMPFGLHSAPATFQRLLDTVVCQKFEDFAVAYLDDIIIFSETFGDHMSHLRSVLEALRKANLSINLEKSAFCKKELKYLGHIVGQGGIQTDPDKVRAISELEPPTTVTGVRRILGMIT